MPQDSTTRITTNCFESFIEPDVADVLFKYYRDNIQWVEAPKSKGRHTRFGSVCSSRDPITMSLVEFVVENVGYSVESVTGVYLNYYKDGDDYTPTHSHPGTIQIILSLGAERVLEVAKKLYPQKSGTVTVFGGSKHGVPRSETLESRISVAIFIQK